MDDLLSKQGEVSLKSERMIQNSVRFDRSISVGFLRDKWRKKTDGKLAKMAIEREREIDRCQLLCIAYTCVLAPSDDVRERGCDRDREVAAARV